MGTKTGHEISHSAKALLEMTAIHNRRGLGRDAVEPHLFPIPPFHKQRRVILNACLNDKVGQEVSLPRQKQGNLIPILNQSNC